MKNLLTVVVVITFLGSFKAQSVDLAGPYTNSANGHIYRLLPAMTWSNAEAAAVSMGGHLVTINDAAEQQWVYGTFAPLGDANLYLWIGLTAAEHPGTWTWVDGSPSTYRFWSPGEPNNFMGAEYYGGIFLPPDARAAQWNDAANIQPQALGVVEINPPVVSEPFTNSANGHIYRLLPAMTWSNAESAAVSMGGHLVTINDAAEQQWVYGTFAPLGGTNIYLWIGLTAADHSGTWTWVDGSPSTYRFWSPGEPNNFTGAEYYGAIFLPPDARAAQWNDAANIQPQALGVVEINPPMIITTIRVSEVEICWSSPFNQQYQVQYRSGLTPNAWINLGAPVVGNGSTNCITDLVPRGEPLRIYRVVTVP